MKKTIILFLLLTAIACYGQSLPEAFSSDKVYLAGNESRKTMGWINYESPYCKIGVARDGIFRITPALLTQNGINISGIDPGSFQLFESGKELPVFVYGQDDGTFNGSDYIEFYGSKHYSKKSAREINPDGVPYNNFLDKYTDTTIYFLTWGSEKGKRIPEQNAFNSGISDTLNYYSSFIHIEQNNVYQSGSVNTVRNQHSEWLETEAWYWGWLGVGNLNFTLNALDLIPEKNSAVYFKALSAGSNTYLNAHNLIMKVNNSKIDSQSINKNSRLLLGKVFSSSLLKEGSNSLNIQNLDNGTNPNILIFDWYEFEYPRKLKAVNDSLRFEIRDSVKSAQRIIRIENVLSDSIIIYKIMPLQKKITNFRRIGTVLFFTDTVSAGSAYVVTRKDKITSPEFIYKKQFINLSDSKRKAEYVAITHKLLGNAAREYTGFIKSSYGVSEILVFTEDIFDEFSYGYPEPEAIKEFLQTANKSWMSPKPVYLSLLGSANYDYKDYTFINRGIKLNLNLVPSFGEPVSDAWFAIWDSSFIPKMQVGRIPANTSAELLTYLEKHKTYVSQQYDDFNKSAIYFSGGNGSVQSELDELRRVNSEIIHESSSSRPSALNNTHFYKTASPVSDFGPYQYSFVDSVIKAGALFVSYIGHSGTRTWDNSIAEPYQLNNTRGKSFLVTDFGCSTSKFAEPDVAAFATLFVMKGQAIAYIGNTSLGFMNTTTTVPQLFYRSVLKDSAQTLGRAHLNSKIEMFKKFGNTEINQIFSLTNSLVGDPIIKLALPGKPNLKVESDYMRIAGAPPTDQDDSVRVSILIRNLGISPVDTFTVSVTDKFESNIVYEKKIKRIIPLYNDPLNISIPVSKRTGAHSLSVTLDPDNHINELYENDNSAVMNFNVFSLSLRPLSFDNYLAVFNNKIRFLNPSTLSGNGKQQIILEIDSTADFKTSKTFMINFTAFVTDFDLTGQPRNRRLFARTRSDEKSAWTKEFSFQISDSLYPKIMISDNAGFEKQQLSSLSYRNNHLQLSSGNVQLNVKSGGGDVSKYGSININGVNILPNTFSWGMGIAVIDEKTMHVDTAKTFWNGDNPAETAALTDLINKIPSGKLVVMNAIDDAQSGLTSQLKAAIKTLGSTKVDSISFRGPWLLIGKKGAAPGNVIEIVKNRSYLNILSADTSFSVLSSTGRMTTEFFGPAGKWKTVRLTPDTGGNFENLKPKLIGRKVDGSLDTLHSVKFDILGNSDLQNVNSSIYPYLKLQTDFIRNQNLSSPLLNSVRLDFAGAPELGLNYQTVSISKDTLQRGDMLDIDFSVFNAGETRADSVRIKVEVVRGNNDKEIIFNAVADSIPPNMSKDIQIKFNSADSHGLRYLVFNVDPENKIKEVFEDNNYYNVPFFISPDTTIPYVKTTFDGNDIMNGDYVSVTPEIRVELSDDSFLPVSDTSAISLVLNNKPVWYRTTPELKINYSASNPKAVAIYKPLLANGEYKMKVTAKNTAGNFADIPDSVKIFVVSDQLKILDLYNYPNPFRNDTYFTFKLSQIPETMRIKIYSVAGRLIKNIEISGTELKYDFNKIHWDGRDQDGDLLANGTYFYKVTIEKDGKSESYIRKLAIIR